MNQCKTALAMVLASFALTGLGADLRIGMIGLDTSHVTAFTGLLNDPKSPNHIAGAKVVAAFKGGSPDIESSWSRLEGYTAQLQRDFGVRIVESISLQTPIMTMLREDAGKELYFDEDDDGTVGPIRAVGPALGRGRIDGVFARV